MVSPQVGFNESFFKKYANYQKESFVDKMKLLLVCHLFIKAVFLELFLPGLSLKASAASCNKTEFFSASAGASATTLGRNLRLAGAAAAGSPSTSGCELVSGLGEEGLKKLALI